MAMCYGTTQDVHTALVANDRANTGKLTVSPFTGPILSFAYSCSRQMMARYSDIHCKIVSALSIVIAVVLLIVLLRMLCFEVLRVSRVSYASLLKRAVLILSDAILRLYRPVAIPVQILLSSF
jgi:hypothetical protein